MSVSSTLFQSIPCAFVTDPSCVQMTLPQHDPITIAGLMNVYRGPEGGCMETLGLTAAVTSHDVVIHDAITIKVTKELFAIDLEWEATHPQHIVEPKWIEFTAVWDSEKLMDGSDNNILGDNGGLYFDVSKLSVPVEKATAETLAYYGAYLIPEKTAVRFPDKDPFPIWVMQVGGEYVHQYIMTETGGGFYLEFHHDQPHFHMIVDGGGYYLLAKEVAKSRFQLTAFELSNGQAVYTKKGAIHCDAALTGTILCGYNAAHDCETVLLRTAAEHKMVELNFQ